MAQQCQVWMGSLQPYMSEEFILDSFRQMGEDPQTVKLMTNKFTGDPAGYCFVSFPSDEAAFDAMNKLNGKPIPGTNPMVRFRLNSASQNRNGGGAPAGAGGMREREFSLWVGDLSSEVDDYNLYRVFSEKYPSIKSAKVILDETGFCKGYGFVKFGAEDEQAKALYEMNGFTGLGAKPLRVSNAVNRTRQPQMNSYRPRNQYNNSYNQQYDNNASSYYQGADQNRRPYHGGQQNTGYY